MTDTPGPPGPDGAAAEPRLTETPEPPLPGCDAKALLQRLSDEMTTLAREAERLDAFAGGLFAAPATAMHQGPTQGKDIQDGTPAETAPAVQSVSGVPTEPDGPPGGRAPGAATAEWQRLDLLRQTAQDLALVLQHLADSLPHGLPVDAEPALRRFQLHALAARLRGSDTEAPAEAGVADFFI
ncbi:hypothetical protein [Halodurantibacterium flavum]|uniref:Uncharacterized protein n=1 Tax=Halodurantibacterium flavum TaxID=1382802 RepID=A0ABW4S556_9RHOB